MASKSKYRVVTTYKDGTVRTLETSDSGIAMREASSASYEEEQPKKVALEKDGETIFSEDVKSYKDDEKASAIR